MYAATRQDTRRSVDFICFEAVLIHRLWTLICCTIPDALFWLQAGRTRAVAKAQIRTADFTRKIMLQKN